MEWQSGSLVAAALVPVAIVDFDMQRQIADSVTDHGVVIWSDAVAIVDFDMQRRIADSVAEDCVVIWSAAHHLCHIAWRLAVAL